MGAGSSSGSVLRTEPCRSAASRPKQCSDSKLESEASLVEPGVTACKSWFARWPATYRDGRPISGSAKPQPCWTVSISGFDVACALPPVSNGAEEQRDMPDCGSFVLVMIWRPARQDISGVRGGSAVHRLSPMPCRPLTSNAWGFLCYVAHSKLNPNEPPCTDPYARWCDRERE